VSDRIIAAVMTAPRQPIELREFSAPDLAPGSALLRTERSEVCGTDVHLWHGRLAGVPYPIIPGHVSAGTLQSVRGPVGGGGLRGLDGSTLREGDRVAFFDVHRTCGRCRACTVHRTPTRCTARRVYGITDSAADGLFGGWSQGIYLEPGVGIARLPDGVEFDDYIGGGCGLLTAVHIIERAAMRPGDTVLVQGTGAVGLSAIALARLNGASTIIAVGAPQDRLAMARRMGADHVFDIASSTPAQRLEEVHALTHGEGVDVVLEAAGSAAAIEEGLDLARDGGRYVVAGHYTDVGDSSINAHRQINRKHLEIRGCWGSEAGHFLRALTFLERYASSVPWREIGGRTYPLSRLDDALADAEAMRITKALVDPWAAA
jgi:threonine dehydrogenase-like Zn-dependent dehydrogenase